MSDIDWKSILDKLSIRWKMGGVITPAPAAASPGLSDGAVDIASLNELSIGKTSSEAAVGHCNVDVTPRLVHRSENTLIHRCGSDEGIKTILGDDPSVVQQHMARLEHEQQIFKHLPPSYPRRKTIKTEQRDDGRFSIHFEWVNGITLEEWLRVQGQYEYQQHQQGQAFEQDAFKIRLRVAIAIAKTLNDYHDSGVAHTALSKMNMIVETYDTNEGNNCIIVNLIHLSQSIVMKQCEDESFAKRAELADLEALGRVYQSLFGPSEDHVEQQGIAMAQGKEDSGENEDYEEGRTKRSKSSTEQDINGGLPPYMIALISALDNKGNRYSNPGEKYDSAKQVLNDLKAADEKFETYFRPFDWKEASLWNHLPVLPSAFYGRQAEMSILMNSLNSVLNNGQPTYCVVGGMAGMGKTKLVNQLKKEIEGRNGHLIIAKFDMENDRPDAVLFGALNDFFSAVVEKSNDGSKARMSERIRAAFELSFGIGDLLQSIPNLNKLVGNDCTSIDLSAIPQQQLLHRSNYLLCKLIGAIADAQNPVALLFDDLQWCDETSLSAIQMIVMDPEIQYCLHLGCYRDNEGAQAVEQMVTNVKNQIQVSTINLGPFEKEVVNTLVSESLCLPPSLSQPLSTIIHTKTAGSPLFCVNFLDEGMIRFNLTTRRWEYDIRDIMMKESPPSVVQYMKSQMTKLPPSYRLVLKLASCLGHRFDRDTFLKARVKSGHGLEKLLPSVCQIGFLHQIPPDNSPNPDFMWAHDQLRRAAYLLIPDNMREQFHLLIGTRLLMNAPEDENKPAIFTILVHMNKGIRLIQNPDQKYEVARLNLIAGEACIKSSSFHSAADYFSRGIQLLPENCWEVEYNLTLNLHDAAQEALFVSGDFPLLRLLNTEVITKAKTFDDKLNSYNNLTRYLVSLGKMEEAISTCTHVLHELEEPMPVQVTNEACFLAAATTKAMLAKYPGDKIVELPQMTDAHRLAAIEFLQTILLGSYIGSDPRRGMLLVSKAIQMTLEFGLCEASTYAFAVYATMLVHGKMKDLEGAYFYGNCAIKLLNVLGASRFKARVFAIVYGFVYIWRDPFQASLPPLLEAYNVGCITGDIEYAFRGTYMYSAFAFCSGQHLTPLKHEMRTYAKKALQCQCKQIGAELGILPYLSSVLELTGDASKEDIYQDLLGTTEHALFQQLLDTRNDQRLCFQILNNRKLLYIFKGDMENASRVHDLILDHPVTRDNVFNIKSMPYILGAFSDGLIAFFCARKNGTDKVKWTKIGEGMIETFKAWKISSSWNFSNKLYLLQGEYHCNLGQNDLALEKYNAAIKAARDHRFTHEEGLAHYLCAQSHHRIGQHKEVVLHLAEARKCYERWGAIALVQTMEHEIQTVTLDFLSL